MRTLTDKAIQFGTFPVVPRKRIKYDVEYTAYSVADTNRLTLSLPSQQLPITKGTLIGVPGTLLRF